MVTYDDRPWTKNYDEGIPASFEPYPEMRLFDFLKQSAEKYPKQAALVSDVMLPVLGHQKHSLTYKQLDKQTDAMAAALIDLGIEKGDKVAIVMPNVASFVIAFYGTLKAGGVVAANNPTYPARKLQHYIDYCDAKVIITLNPFYKTLKEIQPGTKARHIIVADIKDSLPRMAKFLYNRTKGKQNGYRLDELGDGDFWMQDLLKEYDGQEPDVMVTPDDAAFIQYTGGITGTVKGALATHRALVTSAYQITAWTQVEFENGKLGDDNSLPTVIALPMFHVFGVIVLLSRGIASGQTNILVADPRDINGLVNIIDHYKPGVFGGVPKLYSAISDHSSVKSGKIRFDSILIAITGAAPMHPSIKEDFEAAGGRCLTEACGMSEIPCGTHCNPLLGEHRSGSIGVPFPDVDCAIVDLDDEVTEMSVGEVGEIVINAPHMMSEYYKMPEESKSVLREREDGRLWVYTGDIGYMDEDGYFYLVGRKKNMILIGGFNVYPLQIEEVLRNHPAVADVRVAGIPHPKNVGEEAVKAWVILEQGQKVKNAELVSYCKEFLGGYEIPRRYEFVDELPQIAPHHEIIRTEEEHRERVSV
jgi:long-chain acyl-CoA synthetase